MISAAPAPLSKAPHISKRAFQVRAIAAVSGKRDLQRQAVSWFEISLRDGLTVAALQERSATTIVLLQAFDLRFHSETNRTERKAQFRRTETENTAWFDALAEEQLALIADGIFHGSSFHLVLRLNFLSINAACRGECGGCGSGLR